MQTLMSKPFLELSDLNGGGLRGSEEDNLSVFFRQVSAIRSEMGGITDLLANLCRLSQDSKSIHRPKLLRGISDQMDSDMAAILRKAKSINLLLKALDDANAANRRSSPDFAEGSAVDRTRIIVTGGVREKLREMMGKFRELRDRIVGDVGVGEGGGVCLETAERSRAVKEMQRSLDGLKRVFLDMEAIVEKQGEVLNDIERNMDSAKSFVSIGTGKFSEAFGEREGIRKGELLCFCLVAVALLLILLVLVFLLSD